MALPDDDIQELARLLKSGEQLPNKWRHRLFPDTPRSPETGKEYHFYFLSPEDYTKFFQRIKANEYAGWRSTLMQELNA